MEKQLLTVAAYVYSSCEDKNITLGSLRHFGIVIINIKDRTMIVYNSSFNKIRVSMFCERLAVKELFKHTLFSYVQFVRHIIEMNTQTKET
jgi:hypothetical protein